jgi:hypothetical protein
MNKFDHVIDPEGWLFGALLDMVLDHCSVPGDKLMSFGWSSNAEAMRLLGGARFIEIEAESGDELVAHELPAAAELQRRIRLTNAWHRQNARKE